MKKLDKKTIEEMSQVNDAALEAGGALTEAIDAYNTLINDENEKIEELLVTYNEKLADIRSFCEGIVTDIQEYVDDRSEKWQESEAAGNYETWKSMWEEQVPAEEVTITLPEPIEQIDMPTDDGYFQEVDTELPA